MTAPSPRRPAAGRIVAAPTTTTVTTDVGELPVAAMGPRDGAPILLLHGFPGSAGTWTETARRLAGLGYRTIAPTQRGYAPQARPRRTADYRARRLAEDVLRIADAVGAVRFHLVGHDWGALVGWYVAAHHGGRVRSFTALSTPHPRAVRRALLTSDQALRSAYVVAWQAPVLPEAVLTARDGALLYRLLTASGLGAEHADRYRRELLDPGALTAALNWYRAAFRRPLDLASVGSVAVPVQHVWSGRDVAIAGQPARRTGRQVRGPYRYVELDALPHWLPEMAPARCAELIDEFVAAHDRRDAAEQGAGTRGR